jgi:uncharacterized protein YbbK (DUF523 family)
MTTTESTRVRIGISSCLLGEKVRFDGGHKKDEFLTISVASAGSISSARD